MSNTIIVLVPGTTGSTLVTSGGSYDPLAPVWRAKVLTALLRGNESGAQSLLEEQSLYPGVLVPPLLPGGGYQSFIDYFENPKNLQPGQSFAFCSAETPMATSPTTGTTTPWGLPASLTGNLLIAFPYDWRQDCMASATLLQQLLSAIDGLYASSGYQLFLVGHSMGGLVCRAYLENVGAADSWRAKIQGLITLGTPHLGAPLAMAAIMNQLGQVAAFSTYLSIPGSQTLIHNFVDTSFSDSSYELLPPPVLEGASQPPFTQYIQDGSEWYNLLDANLPSEIGTAVTTAASQSLPAGTTDEYAENIQSAAKFFETLNYTGTASGSTPPLPPYYCVVGSGSTTVTGFLYDSSTQTLQAQSTTDGDELVPQWSAAFTGRAVPVAGTYPANGVNHFSLPADPGVQGQVAAWIGVEPQQAQAVREPAAAAAV